MTISYNSRPTVAQLKRDLQALPSGTLFRVGRILTCADIHESFSKPVNRYVSIKFGEVGEVEFFDWDEMKKLADRIGEVAKDFPRKSGAG